MPSAGGKAHAAGLRTSGAICLGSNDPTTAHCACRVAAGAWPGDADAHLPGAKRGPAGTSGGNQHRVGVRAGVDAGGCDTCSGSSGGAFGCRTATGRTGGASSARSAGTNRGTARAGNSAAGAGDGGSRADNSAAGTEAGGACPSATPADGASAATPCGRGASVGAGDAAPGNAAGDACRGLHCATATCASCGGNGV